MSGRCVHVMRGDHTAFDSWQWIFGISGTYVAAIVSGYTYDELAHHNLECCRLCSATQQLLCTKIKWCFILSQGASGNHDNSSVQFLSRVCTVHVLFFFCLCFGLFFSCTIVTPPLVAAVVYTACRQRSRYMGARSSSVAARSSQELELDLASSRSAGAASPGPDYCLGCIREVTTYL